jgi:hypothetical protein
MTEVSRSSIDGERVIEEVEIDGRKYDIPDWIGLSEFKYGVQSGGYSDGLSALVSCKLHHWEGGEDFDPNGDYESDDISVFEVEFFIPFGEFHEIIVNRFVPTDNFKKNSDIRFTDEGVFVKFLAKEYFDYNAIQVHLLPKDLDKVIIPSEDEYDEEDFDSVDLFEETVEELQENWSKKVNKVTSQDGIYQEVTGPENEPYFLLVKVHED